MKALFEDQINFIKDRSHKRKVTEENGLNSLAYACAADKLASAAASK